MRKVIHLYDKTTGGAACVRVPAALANTSQSLLDVTCKWCLRSRTSVSTPRATSSAASTEAMQDLLLTYRSPCGKPGHFSNLAGSVIASLPESGEELYCVNCQLEEKLRLVKGAMAAQDEREQIAGKRIGIPWEESGCDWPDTVADAFEWLRARLAAGIVTYRVEQSVGGAEWVPVITVTTQKAAEEHVSPAFLMRVIEITTMERVCSELT